MRRPARSVTVEVKTTRKKPIQPSATGFGRSDDWLSRVGSADDIAERAQFDVSPEADRVFGRLGQSRPIISHKMETAGVHQSTQAASMPDSGFVPSTRILPDLHSPKTVVERSAGSKEEPMIKSRLKRQPRESRPEPEGIDPPQDSDIAGTGYVYSERVETVDTELELDGQAAPSEQHQPEAAVPDPLEPVEAAQVSARVAPVNAAEPTIRYTRRVPRSERWKHRRLPKLLR